MSNLWTVDEVTMRVVMRRVGDVLAAVYRHDPTTTRIDFIPRESPSRFGYTMAFVRWVSGVEEPVLIAEGQHSSKYGALDVCCRAFLNQRRADGIDEHPEESALRGMIDGLSNIKVYADDVLPKLEAKRALLEQQRVLALNTTPDEQAMGSAAVVTEIRSVLGARDDETMLVAARRMKNHLDDLRAGVAALHEMMRVES